MYRAFRIGSTENRLAIASRAPRFLGAIGRENQHARRGVFQVEAKFVFLVRGIQRRRGTCHRRRKKRHQHRQAIRERDTDAIATRNAS
jgi:hypothetical protein